MNRHTLIERSFVVLAALGAATVACTEPKGAADLTSASIGSFTFAPPPDATFTRVEQCRIDYALVGAAMRRSEVRELRWRVAVENSDDGYLITQNLTHLVQKLDGATRVDLDVPPDLLTARLTIDGTGNLTDIRGLEDTSGALAWLAGAQGRPVDASIKRSLDPNALKRLIAMRYDILVGHLIGHSAAPGSSWSVTAVPGRALVSTKYSVKKLKPCDQQQCATIEAKVHLDPSVLRAEAQEIVMQRVRALGGDPANVRIKSAKDSMSGTLNVEPSTLLVHDASLDEKGLVVVGLSDDTATISVTGRTRVSYDYTAEPALRSGEEPLHRGDAGGTYATAK
jgi:hypothetical protein